MTVWLQATEGDPVQGEVRPLDRDSFVAAQDTWIPDLELRKTQHLSDEDFVMWLPKLSYDAFIFTGQSGQRHGFALQAEQRIQGMVVLHVHPNPSRLDPSGKTKYVHYVAAAPWNRGSDAGRGRFRRVGTLLLAYAAHLSRSEGCAGRLGLHSLTQSAAFYHRIGFQGFGPDAAHRGMHYFELGPEQADTLLAELSRR